ncbi:hypothetical protein PENSPDRAFT_680407 [Peniophora sp. CONT]|nr:hypothetical protein PENSPDRAFT_680407 [Peniophora sp. CONT]
MAQHGTTDVFSLSTTPYLPRGKACANCRLRKMKCDGVRPTCGPCTRADRGDCEYTATAAPSTTRSLERKVTQLRGRLRDLERAQGSGQSAAKRHSSHSNETVFQPGEVASQPGSSWDTTAAGPSGTPVVSSGSLVSSQGSFGGMQLADPSSATAPRDLGNASYPGRSSGTQASGPSSPGSGAFSTPRSPASGQVQTPSHFYPASAYQTPASTTQYIPPPAASLHVSDNSSAHFTWPTFGPPAYGPPGASAQFIVPNHAISQSRPNPANPYALMNVFLRADLYQPLWFLHRASFIASTDLPEGEPGRAHPSLVAAVAAYGAVSSGARDVVPGFIDRALDRLNVDIGAGTAAYGTLALQSMQARILLGNLLLSRGEVLHGADVLTGACALARTLLLHVPPHQHVGFLDGILEAPLPPPSGPIAAAERAGAAWVAATLERLWAMARGVPPRVALADVRAPWPQTPEVATVPPGPMPQVPPFHEFLYAGTVSAPVWNGDNALELIVTAAAVFEAASRVSTALVPDPQQAYAIEGRIEALLLGLGAVQQSDPRTLPAHVLVHGAALQLHAEVAGDPRAMQAGRALAGISTLLRNPGVAPGYLEPAMAMILPAASRALLAGRAVDPNLSADVDAALNAIQETLQTWAQQSAFIQVQLERVVQERAGLF